jgi:hypothetical protein
MYPVVVSVQDWTAGGSDGLDPPSRTHDDTLTVRV